MSKKNDVLPSADFVQRLNEDYKTDLSDSASARQSLSTSLRNAEKEHNLHTAAFKKASALERQGTEKAQAFIRHFFHYCKALELLDQTDAFDDIPTEEIDDAMSKIDEAALEDATVN